RENRQLAEVAAAEKIEDAENRAGRLLKHLLQNGLVDSRCGNVGADAVDPQKGQREQHAVPQVFDAEHVLHGFDESVHACFLRNVLMRDLKAVNSTLRPQMYRQPWYSFSLPIRLTTSRESLALSSHHHAD